MILAILLMYIAPIILEDQKVVVKTIEEDPIEYFVLKQWVQTEKISAGDDTSATIESPLVALGYSKITIQLENNSKKNWSLNKVSLELIASFQSENYKEKKWPLPARVSDFNPYFVIEEDARTYTIIPNDFNLFNKSTPSDNRIIVEVATSPNISEGTIYRYRFKFVFTSLLDNNRNLTLYSDRHYFIAS